MTRKLVTIREVRELVPIEGADFIELAMVDGWQCVVKKGEFKVGDFGLYFEIDSFLPEIPVFEFLRSGSTFRQMEVDGTLQGGFKLRTIRLRKQLSQGLLLPTSTFPDIDFTEDRDYSSDIGVIKWEPRISPQLRGLIKGQFPTDIIRKTNQERIQNMSKTVGNVPKKLYEITEKLDGTSATYYRYFNKNIGEEDSRMGVCSRNLDLKPGESVYWQINDKYNILTKLEELKMNYAIQGEIIGEGIQKNPYGIVGQEFYVFDVWDIDNQRYLGCLQRYDVCKVLGLKSIPVITHGFAEKTMQEFLDSAEGKSKLNENTEREGIVYKSCELDESKEIISFKIISNKFLLKEKD